MSAVSRRLLRALPWLLVPLLLLVALVGWLAFTSQGARTLIDYASERFDVDLRRAGLDGSLARGLDVSGLALRLPGLSVTLGTASLRWQPLALLRGRLVIDRLDVADGELRVTTTEDAEGDTGATRVPLPIDIESLTVRNLTLAVDDTTQHVDRFSASLAAADDDFTLRQFTLEMDAHRASGRAAVRDGGAALDVELDYAGHFARADGELPLAATLKLAGPRSRVQLALALSAPFEAAVAGTVDLAAAAPQVDLRGHASPDPWLATQDIAARVGRLELTLGGTLQTARLQLEATLQLPDAPSLALTLSAARLPDRADGGLRAQLDWRLQPAAPLLGAETFAGGGELAWHDGQLQVAQTLTAPAPVELRAAVELGARPLIDARAEWQSLALTVDGTTLRSPQGRLTVAGHYPELDVTFTGRLDEDRVGAVDLDLRARLAEGRADLTQLDARLLDGRLQASGALSALTPLRGEFTLAARGLDLARLREDLSTTLDADVALALEGPRVRVTLAHAGGRWRDQTLDARGALDIATDTQRAQLDDLRLAIGRNRLTLNGSAGPELALDFSLDAPRIAEIDASLAGALRGSGSVRGTPEAPVLAADLSAQALRTGDLRIGQATLQASIAPAAASSLTLDAGGLRQGDTALGDLHLEANGRLESHAIALDGGRDQRRVSLRAHAAYAAGHYDGTLEALTLAWPEFGTWLLGDEARWQWADGRLSLTPLCLAKDSARVCVDAARLAADAGRVHAQLAQVPTSLAAPWLPPQLAIDGKLEGELSATFANGRWQPQGELRGEQVSLEAYQAGDRRTRLAFAPLELTFSTTEDGQRFAFEADSAELGAVRAGGSVRGTPDAPVIDARLDAAALDLDALAALVPALGGSAGHLAVQAQLAGPLSAPAVTAQGKLVDGKLRFERPGIELDMLRFDAAMRTPTRLELDLTLGQAEQRMTVTGHVERAAAWPFALHVASDGFAVMRRAELDVDIAPELDLDGTVKDIRLRGSLGLPLLHIRLQKLPADAVAVSADEVVLDEAGEVIVADRAESSAQRFFRDHVTGDLRIEVGADARVTGMGLDAKLGGALQFSKDAGSLGFADGRIELEEGEYVAYRQTLEIERGRLLFAGPLDNPALDVLALRPDLDIKAGVAISGTVQAPIVRLYSVPAMSDLETLSYVITGEPLSGTDKSAGSMLAKAALGLGLEKAGGLTDQLRDWFALDELGLSGGDTVEDTSFVAGKQLSPRMKVRSEFNPFDRLWSVFVNYELTEHWSVEGESGARQGADLLYSIEREALF